MQSFSVCTSCAMQTDKHVSTCQGALKPQVCSTFSRACRGKQQRFNSRGTCYEWSTSALDRLFCSGFQPCVTILAYHSSQLAAPVQQGPVVATSSLELECYRERIGEKALLARWRVANCSHSYTEGKAATDCIGRREPLTPEQFPVGWPDIS